MSVLMPDIAIMEKILRSVVVSRFLLVSFRLAGKRLLGQLTAFDLVVLLIISNVLQNAAIGDDTSRGGGLLGAFVIIIALNSVAAWLTYRDKRRQRPAENVPTVLIRHGRVVRTNLDREHMTMAELRAALRTEGVASVSEVRGEILEEGGRVGVIHRGAQPA